MTSTGYSVGAALLLASVAPLVWSARTIRRSLAPDLDGPLSWLGGTVLFLALFFAVLQMLGTIGLFRRFPIACACLAIGVVTAAWARVAGAARATGHTIDTGRERSTDAQWRWTSVIVGFGVALAVAPWVLATWATLHKGISGFDSIYYHLPYAADMAQSGRTTGLHFSGLVDETPYDPQNSELLHAFGMVMLQRDLLSPVINLLWLSMGGVAAWCLGRSRAVAPATLAAFALVISGPLFVSWDAGQATNDIADIALLLAVVALAFNSGGRPLTLSVAAMAAGLGLSNKLSLVVPVAAITLAVVAWTPLRQRFRVVRVWLFSMALTGSYWYLRNMVRTGSPLPSLKIGFGGMALPHVHLAATGDSLAASPLTMSIWQRVYVPGLHMDLGPLWLFTVAIAATGIVVGLATRDRVVRAVAFAASVCTVGYVFTPQTGGLLFQVNLRFFYPSLILAVMLIPLSPLLQSARRQALIIICFTVVTVATQTSYLHDLRPRPVLLVYVVGACGIGVVAYKRHTVGSRRHIALSLVALLLVVAGGGWALQRTYFAGRYKNGEVLSLSATQALLQKTQDLRGLYEWANHISDRRIGFVGFDLPYPLFGPDLSNRVQPVGFVETRGQFRFAVDCPEWRRAVNDGGYDYVVTVSTPGFFGAKARRERSWMLGATSAHVVLADTAATVFAITGRLDPRTC